MNPKQLSDFVGTDRSLATNTILIDGWSISVDMTSPWGFSGEIVSDKNERATFSGHLVDISTPQITELTFYLGNFVDERKYWDSVELLLKRITGERMYGQ